LAIPPTAPETRFGYVHRSEALGQAAYRVEKFHEKPDRHTAERYLSSGDFAWNGGIFAFRAGDYLDELEHHRPALAAALRKSVAEGEPVDRKFYPESSNFSLIKPESVDYAVMENTDRAAMVLTQMGWSDVGDWPTVRQLRSKDRLGNAIKGSAQLIDSRNSLVDTDGPKVHLVGMEDVIVVVDGNDILVASTRDAGRIGRLADSPIQ
jgi:mannose-1-phosphate guanylyltransferase